MLQFVLVKHFSVCIEVYCMSVMRLSQILSCPFPSGPTSPQSSGFPLHPIHPITAWTLSLYYVSSHSEMALLFIVHLDHLAGNPPPQLHLPSRDFGLHAMVRLSHLPAEHPARICSSLDSTVHEVWVCARTCVISCEICIISTDKRGGISHEIENTKT